MGVVQLSGQLTIPKTDGVEVAPGIVLIGKPSPRPDLGDNVLVCLANIKGMLGLVQLRMRFMLEYEVKELGD